MDNYLVTNALTNIWCTPDQDNQVILKPSKITPNSGVWNSWKFLWTTVDLPIKGIRFHLYQIGQIHPLLINLFPKTETWIKISEACNLSRVICDIYLGNGIQLPRTETWYMITDEKNILIAVKENKNISFNPLTDDIYFRAYSNEYFASKRAISQHNEIFVNGVTVNSVLEILSLQAEIQTKSELVGEVYAFCNGYKVKDLSLVSAKVGDTIEYVYDSSINKVVDFKVNKLGTFDSELDSKGKYLLHYSGGIGETIDYRDDIDVFLIDGTTQRGIYFHKNMDDALRMVTHRDYSVPIDNILYYLTEHNDVINISNVYLRLHIRNSGYKRTLVNEHNRIKELYKLPDNNINSALLGIDSTVINWTAAELENSAYCKIMGVKSTELTHDMTLDAYGYNAISKMVADNPIKAEIFSFTKVVKIPYLFQNGSTVFEYDQTGKLLGYANHTTGADYTSIRQECEYIEVFMGLSSDTIDEYYDLTTFTLDPNLDYRFYVKQSVHDSNTPAWEDVTSSAKYHLDGNNFTWLVPSENKTLIRSNKTNVVAQLEYPLDYGPIEFNLQARDLQVSPNVNKLIQVPLGELDVYLNGHHLIENLDYFVVYPKVTIVNKSYLIQDEQILQKVIYKLSGLCNTDLSRTAPAEFGYIVNDVISNNNKYDIRDDKVICVFVDGLLKVSSDLKFNEDNGTFLIDSEANGKPYIIKNTVIPLKGITGLDTYDYIKVSEKVDDVISNYLTLKLPEADSILLNPIRKYHELYSPFICKLMLDLMNGVLDIPFIKQEYNDDQIREVVQPYLDILDNDPTSLMNTVSNEYNIIYPHYFDKVLSLDIYHYSFLNRVIGLYSNNLVNLSSMVKLIEINLP